MRKIKCDVCGHYHGGFHLCVGAEADPRLRLGDRVIGEYEKPAAPKQTRWEREHEKTRERDEQILAMYNHGFSLNYVGKQFDLSHPTIRQIVLRMGGTMRSKQGV